MKNISQRIWKDIGLYCWSLWTEQRTKADFREDENYGIQAIKAIWGRNASDFSH